MQASIKAARHFDRGLGAAEVARRLGVTRQSAHEWKKAWEAGGKQSLRSSGPAGPKPRLDQSAQQQLVDALLEGPQAAGYATDVWTLPRVRALITKLSGEVYDPAHVSRLLRSLGFSCQRPERRAIERDEPKIAHWKRVEWPAIKKKARRQKRTIVFVDESGLSTRPHRVRTWAPRGQTPVLHETFNWKSLSIIGGITLWSFFFRIHAGSIKSEQVVEFLKALHRHLKGARLLVIWDGAPIHRSRVISAFIASTNGGIAVDRLPAYAPELNPVEYMWAHLKQHEIGNLVVREAWQLSLQATAALRRMRRRQPILTACFAQAELWP